MALLAGYKYFREVDEFICTSSCLHDPICSAVTYSVYKQHNSSLCKLYRPVNEDPNFLLNLTKQDGSNGIQSNLVLFISKLQNVYLFHAKLKGNSYSWNTMTREKCNSTCTEDLFCDAFSFSPTGNCSMFSTKSITNIVIDDESYATFIGLHSN